MESFAVVRSEERSLRAGLPQASARNVPVLALEPPGPCSRAAAKIKDAGRLPRRMPSLTRNILVVMAVVCKTKTQKVRRTQKQPFKCTIAVTLTSIT